MQFKSKHWSQMQNKDRVMSENANAQIIKESLILFCIKCYP